MYLSKELVLSAYAELSRLTDDPTQQGATQKVSAIRYFLAMDAFIKETAKNKCDAGDLEDKQKFYSYVSDVVAISSERYTPAFYWPLKGHSGDCGTSSNFFSAGQVRLSKSMPSQYLPYPQRGGWPQLLKIKNGNISIASGTENGYENLKWYLGEEKHCVALFIWVARNWDTFDNEAEIIEELKSEVQNHYSEQLVESLFPADHSFVDFLATVSERYVEVQPQINEEDVRSLFNMPNEMPPSQQQAMINDALQLITYGAPGTGKSWRIKKDTKGCEVIRTTFHPDSDYSTFVGAYKPSMEADGYDTVVTTGEKTSGGTISKKDGLVRQKRIVYKFVAQAFLEAYVAAWRKCKAFLAAQDDEAKKAAAQFLVIEEINRGNCAQIFGDIFQLLDREDDGYSSYAIKSDTDLCQFLSEAFKEHADEGIAALDLAGVNFGDRDVTPDEIKNGKKMLLPPNMFIWATMNTSDQSLFPIDSAFKRRWEWKYMPICDSGKGWKVKAGTDEYDWWTFLEKVNDLVQSFTESEDKKLGYFFCKAGGDGVITLEQFVGKVVFYLWNGVFKDAGFDDEVFDDGKGGKLYFKTFFTVNGDPNPESVKQFMKNLGVGVVAPPAENAGGAEGESATEPPAEGAENPEGQVQ